MSYRQTEVQPPYKNTVRKKYSREYFEMRIKRQRRKRSVFLCICILFVSALISSYQYTAHEKDSSIKSLSKSGAIEASAEMGKASAGTEEKAITGDTGEKVKTIGTEEKVIAGGTEAKVMDKSAWYLTLVNQTHPMEEGYVPELAALENGHAVDSRISQSLQEMIGAARGDGLSPMICSSYRSQEEQVCLYEEQVNENMFHGYSGEDAEKQAAVWVAPPGTSEHQLGLAVDIVSESYQLLDETQEGTAEQKWLMEHCAEYGFILRYPTDKSNMTGIGYEPWHYRYVGKDAAQEIMNKRICLEEYLNEE